MSSKRETVLVRLIAAADRTIADLSAEIKTASRKDKPRLRTQLAEAKKLKQRFERELRDLRRQGNGR